jgi:hypothetical protein
MKTTKELIAYANRLVDVAHELNEAYIRAPASTPEELNARMLWMTCCTERNRAHARAIDAVCKDAGLKQI